MERSGFTLVEMLVTSALLVLVLAVLVTLMPIGGTSWDAGAARAEVQQHARIAMEELRYELKYACRVEINAAGTILTYNKNVGGVQRRYRAYVLARQLLLSLPDGTSVPLASCVDSFRLTPGGILTGGDVVRITLTVAEAGQTVYLRSAVLARNLAGDGL